MRRVGMADIKLESNYSKAIKLDDIVCLRGETSMSDKAKTNVLCFAHSGMAELIVASKKIFLNGNDLIFISPGKQYSVKTLSKKDEIFVVKILVVWPDTVFFPNEVMHVGDSVRFYELIKWLCHYSDKGGVPTEVFSACLSVLLSELLVCQSRKKPEMHSRLADEARYWIKMHLSDYDDIMSEFEKVFGYSRGYMRRLFIKEYGQSLANYISELKIGHAINLLANSACTVEKISRLLRFHSPDAFIKFFKYHMDITPLKFRKQIKDGKYGDRRCLY